MSGGVAERFFMFNIKHKYIPIYGKWFGRNNLFRVVWYVIKVWIFNVVLHNPYFLLRTFHFHVIMDPRIPVAQNVMFRVGTFDL